MGRVRALNLRGSTSVSYLELPGLVHHEIQERGRVSCVLSRQRDSRCCRTSREERRVSNIRKRANNHQTEPHILCPNENDSDIVPLDSFTPVANTVHLNTSQHRVSMYSKPGVKHATEALSTIARALLLETQSLSRRCDACFYDGPVRAAAGLSHTLHYWVTEG